MGMEDATTFRAESKCSAVQQKKPKKHSNRTTIPFISGLHEGDLPAQ